MAGGIKVRIQLEGGEQVETTLSDLGAKGAAAFKKLQDATKSIDFDKVKQGADQLRDGVNKIGVEGEAAGRQFAAGMDVAGNAATGAGVAAQNAAGNIGNSFQQAGVTVDGFANKIVDAAFKFGVLVSAAQNAVSLVGKVTGFFDGLVAGSAKAGADAVKLAEKLGVSVEQAQALKSALGDNEKILLDLSKAAGELALKQSAGSTVALDGGAKGTKETVEVRREGADALKKSTDALKGSTKALADEEDDEEESASGAAEATKKLSDAHETGRVNVTRFGAELQKSEVELSKQAQALRDLGVSVSKTDTFTDVLFKLATAFEGVADPIKRAKLADALFTEGQEDAKRAVLGGTAALKASVDEALKSKNLLTTAEAKALDDFNSANEGLTKGLDLLKAKIAAVFAPDKTAGKKFFADLIEANQEAIVGLAKTAKAFLDTFFLAKSADGKTPFSRALEVVKELGETLAKFWESTLLPALKRVDEAFNSLAGFINRAFGTNISGRFLEVALAATVLATALLGLSGNFGTVLSAVGGLLAALLPFAPLFILLGGAAFLFWDQLKKAGTDAFTALGPAMTSFKAALGKLLTGDFGGAWEDFKTGGLQAFEALKPVALQLWEDVKTRAVELWAEVLPLALSMWESIKAAGISLWTEVKAVAAQVWADLKADPNVGGFFTLLESGFVLVTRLAGALKTAIDTVALSFVPLAEGINRIFGTNFSGGDIALLAIMGKLTGTFGAFDLLLVALGTGVTNFVLDVKNLIAETVRLGEAGAAALKKTFDALNPFSSAKSDPGASVLEFLNPFKAFPPEAQKVGDAIEGIKEKAGEAKVAIEGIVPKNDFPELWEGVRRGFAKMWADITGAAEPAGQEIARSAKRGVDIEAPGLFDGIKDGLSKILRDLSSIGADKKATPLKLFDDLPPEAGKAGDESGRAFNERFSAAVEKFRASINVEDRRNGGEQSAFAALSTEAERVFDLIKLGATAFWTDIEKIFDTGAKQSSEEIARELSPFKDLPAQATTAFDQVKALAVDAGQAVKDAFAGGGAVAAAAPGAAPGEQAAAPSGGIFDGLVAAAKDAATAIRDAFNLGDIFGPVRAAIDELRGSLAAIDFSALSGNAEAVAAQIVAAFQGIAAQVQAAFAGLAPAVQSAMSGIESAVSSMVSSVSASLSELEARIKAVAEAAAAAASAGGGGGGGGEGFASGGLPSGLLRGPGTGTSDSMTVRVSTGEYIVNALQTRRWLSLLHLINSGRFTIEKLRSLVGGLPHFAEGGIVTPKFKDGIRAFADGGFANALSFRLPSVAINRPVTGGKTRRTVNLNIRMGDQVIQTVAGEDAISQIHRVANQQKLARAGRAPSWVS